MAIWVSCNRVEWSCGCVSWLELRSAEAPAGLDDPAGAACPPS